MQLGILTHLSQQTIALDWFKQIIGANHYNLQVWFTAMRFHALPLRVWISLTFFFPNNVGSRLNWGFIGLKRAELGHKRPKTNSPAAIKRHGVTHGLIPEVIAKFFLPFSSFHTVLFSYSKGWIGSKRDYYVAPDSIWKVWISHNGKNIEFVRSK